MDISKVLSDYLSAQGITQAEFRRRTGDKLSSSTISNAVSRKNYKPNPETLALFASAMNVSVDELLRLAGEASNETN